MCTHTCHIQVRCTIAVDLRFDFTVTSSKPHGGCSIIIELISSKITNHVFDCFCISSNVTVFISFGKPLLSIRSSPLFQSFVHRHIRHDLTRSSSFQWKLLENKIKQNNLNKTTINWSFHQWPWYHMIPISSRYPIPSPIWPISFRESSGTPRIMGRSPSGFGDFGTRSLHGERRRRRYRGPCPWPETMGISGISPGKNEDFRWRFHMDLILKSLRIPRGSSPVSKNGRWPWKMWINDWFYDG